MLLIEWICEVMPSRYCRGWLHRLAWCERTRASRSSLSWRRSVHHTPAK